MRFVSIDLGDKRTGIAVGDAITRIATPTDVVQVSIREHGGATLLDALARVIDLHAGRGTELVFGLPINMDGTEGPRAKLVREFAARVAAKTGMTVHFQDERLTSADADWSMAGSGLTHKQKKERRDALAAAAILRDFLSARSNESERAPTDDVDGTRSESESD